MRYRLLLSYFAVLTVILAVFAITVRVTAKKASSHPTRDHPTARTRQRDRHVLQSHLDEHVDAS